MSGRPSRARERLLAWLVSGPLARLAAFLLDLIAALWRGARGLPHPEEGRRRRD